MKTFLRITILSVLGVVLLGIAGCNSSSTPTVARAMYPYIIQNNNSESGETTFTPYIVGYLYGGKMKSAKLTKDGVVNIPGEVITVEYGTFFYTTPENAPYFSTLEELEGRYTLQVVDEAGGVYEDSMEPNKRALIEMGKLEVKSMGIINEGGVEYLKIITNKVENAQGIGVYVIPRNSVTPNPTWVNNFFIIPEITYNDENSDECVVKIDVKKDIMRYNDKVLVFVVATAGGVRLVDYSSEMSISLTDADDI